MRVLDLISQPSYLGGTVPGLTGLRLPVVLLLWLSERSFLEGQNRRVKLNDTEANWLVSSPLRDIRPEGAYSVHVVMMAIESNLLSSISQVTPGVALESVTILFCYAQDTFICSCLWKEGDLDLLLAFLSNSFANDLRERRWEAWCGRWSISPGFSSGAERVTYACSFYTLICRQTPSVLSLSRRCCQRKSLTTSYVVSKRLLWAPGIARLHSLFLTSIDTIYFYIEFSKENEIEFERGITNPRLWRVFLYRRDLDYSGLVVKSSSNIKCGILHTSDDTLRFQIILYLVSQYGFVQYA